MKPVWKTVIILSVIVFVVGVIGVGFFVADFAKAFRIAQNKNSFPSDATSTVAPSTLVTTPTESTTVATEEPTINSTEPTTPENIDQFIGTTGCVFSVNEPFELDGVIYTITRIKICSEKDQETPSYNYYKIFYEYTIKNNRNDTITWDMAYNGNLYGLLCHKGAKRNLGGNHFIKDESFNNLRYAPEGTLAAGETVSGYNSLVCHPDSLNYTAETWPLYTNEKFSMVLHLLVDNHDYVLELYFN